MDKALRIKLRFPLFPKPGFIGPDSGSYVPPLTVIQSRTAALRK